MIGSHDRIHAGSQLAQSVHTDRGHQPVHTDNTLREVTLSQGVVVFSEGSAMPHRIRLIGPWDWCYSSISDHSWLRVQLPDGWSGLPNTFDRVLFRRRFHLPTGLQAQDQVNLRFRHGPDFISISLNGHVLPVDFNPYHSEATCCINARISMDNEILIALEQLNPNSPELGFGAAVVLEIVTPES